MSPNSIRFYNILFVKLILATCKYFDYQLIINDQLLVSLSKSSINMPYLICKL